MMIAAAPWALGGEVTTRGDVAMNGVEQRNIEAVARYCVTWGRGEVDGLAEHCTTDFVGHGPSGGPPFDFDGLKARLALFVRGMPGFRITSEDTIAQGDRVVMRWRTRGTFTGVFMDRPPTGASIELTGITIYPSATAAWRSSGTNPTRSASSPL